MRQEGEPSVEEILESIKKVIARDNRDAANAQRQRLVADSRDYESDEEAEEVLELGAEVELADVDEADSPEPPLIADQVRTSMQENFAALALLAEPGAQPQIVRSGETSLEGMVREMLRPMLAQWLDKNLPPMVERLVAAEIARIAGKKG